MMMEGQDMTLALPDELLSEVIRCACRQAQPIKSLFFLPH
jgi:hypothetical protein